MSELGLGTVAYRSQRPIYGMVRGHSSPASQLFTVKRSCRKTIIPDRFRPCLEKTIKMIVLRSENRCRVAKNKFETSYNCLIFRIKIFHRELLPASAFDCHQHTLFDIAMGSNTLPGLVSFGRESQTIVRRLAEGVQPSDSFG